MKQNEKTDRAFTECAEISKKFVEKYSEYELDELIANSHFFAKNVEDLRHLQTISSNLAFGGIPAGTNNECIIKVVDLEIDFCADLCKGGFSNDERIIYVTYLIVNKTQRSLKTISDCPITAFRNMIDFAYLNEKSFYIPSENDVWDAIDKIFAIIKAFKDNMIDFDRISDMSAVTDSFNSFRDVAYELLKSEISC